MQNVDKVSVNSARGSFREPLKIIGATLRDLPSAMSLSWTLASKQMAADFRQSKLGFLWLVLQPALYGAIFVVIKYGMRGAGFEVDTGDAPPALFALIGMTLYQAWLEALTRQLMAVRQARALLRTVRLPAEVLFFQPLITSVMFLIARLLVIAIAVVALGWNPPLQAAWFPLAALGVILTGQAIGFFLLPIASLYRDVNQFISSIALGILLVSPVLYPATTNKDSLLYVLNMFNPLGAPLATARDLILRGDLILLQPALIWFVVSVVVTLIMMMCIRVVLPILVERLA